MGERTSSEFHAGLDATKDPPKCSSPVKMSVIEDHLKLAATTSVEAMTDDDVLLMLSGALEILQP